MMAIATCSIINTTTGPVGSWERKRPTQRGADHANDGQGGVGAEVELVERRRRMEDRLADGDEDHIGDQGTHDGADAGQDDPGGGGQGPERPEVEPGQLLGSFTREGNVDVHPSMLPTRLKEPLRLTVV